MTGSVAGRVTSAEIPLALPGMIGYWDTEERNRFASHAYAAAFGLSPARMEGRKLEEVLGLRGYALARPTVRAALAGHPGVVEGPLDLVDGATRPTWAAYLPDAAGEEVAGVVVLVAERPLLPPSPAPAPEETAAVDVLRERQRIAADLHDTVLQRLYATGLNLTRAMLATDPGTASPYLTAIEEIDDAIVELRAAIVSMKGDLQSSETVSSIDRIVGHAGRVLGFDPELRLHGPVGDIPTPVARHLLAVLNEALSNVARHSHATRVEVVVSTMPDRVELCVADDGVGPGTVERRSGVENMRRRAEMLGGRFALGPNAPRGSLVTWSVPRAGGPGREGRGVS